MKHMFLKVFACALAALACMDLSAVPDEVSYSRQRLFSGFDGKTCKIQPSIATDGSGTVLLAWQNLLLTGSDVFYGESMAKSTDGGKTFGPGVNQKIFADTWEGKIRTTYYGTVNYSKKNRRWYGLGAAQRYVNDKVPMLKSVDGRPATFPMYYTVDPEKGAFTSRHELQVPFKYARTLPFGQKLECDNGDLLVPFYVIPPKNDANHKSYCVVTRCRFEGEMLKVVSAGTPLADDAYPRGIGEPSLAKLNGKYYLTLRTDVQGLWAESDDGVTFSKPRPWRWDDGSLLENYNTQQHWLRPDGALYLAYTRRGAHNDHVFRHRAPIFMAKFDPARGCLVRATEKILVPELGARLGNFNVIDVAPDESWLITAEWMQPLGCEKYGSDNSLWLARVKFKVGKPSRGALCLTFDDRHFANWQRARAVFKKHGAHATFFVYGAIDASAAAAMRTLRADGHSLGLHGFTHARAASLLGKLGAEGYRAAEIAPQLNAAHAQGLAVRNWGYPMSQRNAETDAVLGRDFARMRTGCCWRKGKLSDDPMKAHDELFVPMAEAHRRTRFFGTPVPSCAEGWLEDVKGALERARDRDEVLVLYAHDITADDAKTDPHNITRGQLDAILTRAAALDIPVIGFDELDSIRK